MTESSSPLSSTSTAGAAGFAVVPLVAMAAAAMVLVVLAGGGANAAPTSAACGGGGTGQTVLGVTLDAEQMGNAQTIVSVVAGRRLPVYAADVAVTTAYTESALHNSTVQTDHDSEGLFQQRVSLYTAPVAADPVRATGAFLDRLVQVPAWQTTPVGVDAQTVQRSRYPDRYQPNAALAEQLVGQLWPTAASPVVSSTVAPAAPTSMTAPSTGDPTPTSSTTGSSTPPAEDRPAVCAGGGGAGVETVAGQTGSPVAGVTRVPAGFVMTGSPQARIAITFALSQLGKPYVFGAAGPDSYDCSGLTMAAWAAAGVALPHLAAGQTADGTPEPTNLSQAVGGDLVMTPGSDGTAQNPGHVGMIVGYLDPTPATAAGRQLLIINAPETGVPVELSSSTTWAGLIVDVRHIA